MTLTSGGLRTDNAILAKPETIQRRQANTARALQWSWAMSVGVSSPGLPHDDHGKDLVHGHVFLLDRAAQLPLEHHADPVCQVVRVVDV